jgi:uncharacterized membrane protein
VLGATVWVGGMFFAYMALRPAAARVLEPPLRLALWSQTLGGFFRWVWVAIVLILVSGLHMMLALGGLQAPLYAWAMMVIGIGMMLIFAHVFFAAFRRLERAVGAGDWKAGGAALGQIRRLVGVNLVLGLVTITIATAGRMA